MIRGVWVLSLCILLLAPVDSSALGEEQKNSEDQFEQGRLLLENGDLFQAAAVFEDILTSQPSHQAALSKLFECYRFIGIDYYSQSLYDEAIEVWHKALAIDSENVEIQGYINRCESEKRVIARVSGDSVAVMDTPSLVKVPAPVKVDTVFITLPPVSDSGVPATDVPAVMTSKSSIACGLSSGIAIGTGNPHPSGAGISFTGYLSLLPDKQWLGARLDITYARFYKDFSETTLAPQHLSIFGLNINAITSKKVSQASSLCYCAGIGIYETILTQSIEGEASSITRKSSEFGIDLGISWQRRMRAVDVTVGVNYTYLSGSLSPNLLQISAGITTN